MQASDGYKPESQFRHDHSSIKNLNQYRLIFHAASATATQWRSWAGTKVATLHCESWTRTWIFAFYQIWGVEQHEPAVTNNICIKEPTSSENRSTTTSKVTLLRASTFIRRRLNKKATNCREQHSFSASMTDQNTISAVKTSFIAINQSLVFLKGSED